MAKAGRIYHWKHGWIPISAEAKAYVAGKGPKPVTVKRNKASTPKIGFSSTSGSTTARHAALYGKRDAPPKILQMEGFAGALAQLGSRSGNRLDTPESLVSDVGEWMGVGGKMNLKFDPPIPGSEIQEYLALKQAAGDLLKSIHDDGGFTFNPRTGGLIRPGDVKGVAVAVPGTEYPVGNGNVSREQFISNVSTLIEEHGEELANGAFIGGWYSPDRDEYMVEITELVQDRDAAIALGKERNQEGVFDLGTGEFISTGGTGDAKAALTFPTARDAELLARRLAIRYGRGSRQYDRAIKLARQMKARNG